ncbi:hypothetical protein AB0K92_15225 [Streptomyces sp. NPDC052687]|uniref:hypothetical protein n=1 Tax=unclassified Streptomyces TaxID=2593676 RepID=UPI00140A3235|nr:hypothetical protein [Streptomyces sp. JB150]QIJ61897.1 hypothetical protein G7Z13_07490 [Streptomyces sp. JB150]
MQARTQPRPRPVTSRGADARLPWWALALPVLAFAALLTLILHPSDAHAAAGDPAIARLLERAQQLLTR